MSPYTPICGGNLKKKVLILIFTLRLSLIIRMFQINNYFLFTRFQIYKKRIESRVKTVNTEIIKLPLQKIEILKIETKKTIIIKALVVVVKI